MKNPYETGRFRLTSGYGYRADPFTGKKAFHGGVDLVGIDTKTVTAVKSGIVVRSRIVTDKSDATSQWGQYVAVSSDDGSVIYYCHLSQRLVNTGMYVEEGDVIGIEGMTGRATGSHLHIELRDNGERCDITPLLGIPNAVGTYGTAQPDYERLVTNKCGLEAQTAAYLNAYRYAPDLWRKLWLAME